MTRVRPVALLPPHSFLDVTAQRTLFLSCTQYIIFKITDDKKFIEVEAKGAKDASFDDFCKTLPDGDCRYAVLDVEINTKSGATTNKLIFVAWYARHASLRAYKAGSDRRDE